MNNRTCTIEGCDKKYEAKGWCAMHYSRARSGKDMNAPVRRKGDMECAMKDGRPATHGEYCGAHYARVMRGQSLDTPLRSGPMRLTWDSPEDALSTLMNHTTEEGECLFWKGSATSSNYGHCTISGQQIVVHRVVYALTNQKDVSSIAQVHHKCANRKCINPDHLQEVTDRENMAEMLARNYYTKRIAQLEAEVAELKEALAHGKDATPTG